MLVKTYGSAVYGIDAITITIEVNVTLGTQTFIVGLPDNAVKESILRVESAIKSNGFFMPRTKVIVNMAPADIRKSGSAFDLPIALGILAATDQLPGSALLDNLIVMGELGLDGRIHPIKGALPIAIATKKDKFRGLILPATNATEAALVDQLDIFGVSHLREVTSFLESGRSLVPVKLDSRSAFENGISATGPDFGDVKGQENIKRSLEIAAAGGHNAILIGAPGSGKTMLARRLPSILPPLTLDEALETSRIYSVAGRLQHPSGLVSTRPFRSPHHTISDMALVGGGAVPQPGEISLAHNGVLFLDELPEFRRTVLEVMRQPLEERKVTIARAQYCFDFPASFMLIAAMNPCPCGYYNHPSRECTCSPFLVDKYLSRVSGPLLDRIDLHVEVTPVEPGEFTGSGKQEQSAIVRRRVMAAREIQLRRFAGTGIYCNAQMDSAATRAIVPLSQPSKQLLQLAMNRLALSARAYERILKVARTIADLDLRADVLPQHVAEAIQLRSLDRELRSRH
ncbi:YifB family Mg chelatase-like AAA ATPase [Flavihumibacter petaseus]|uniref:AAA+ ATPase domain-containing protein n=1 Tax=Flavihumibacter petaseus NBRC 106054 TaxID=1220578 RepID=A0A0E9N6M4_9BACT|nr:YifB family Mg chelatase-like AAA ATPase [Flavihumibacter petaseus]GAO44995.1 hypothetical protein FPE01S_04_02380 [Flavihumibacter petaseus NBRC 106054]